MIGPASMTKATKSLGFSFIVLNCSLLHYLRRIFSCSDSTLTRFESPTRYRGEFVDTHKLAKDPDLGMRYRGLCVSTTGFDGSGSFSSGLRFVIPTNVLGLLWLHAGEVCWVGSWCVELMMEVWLDLSSTWGRRM